jgi:hypothetical protein
MLAVNNMRLRANRQLGAWPIIARPFIVAGMLGIGGQHPAGHRFCTAVRMRRLRRRN